MNGVDIAGQGGTSAALVKNDYKTFMPRLGFSYDISGNGKTVVRGGFGTFYERIQGNDIYDAAGSPPFISTPAAGERRIHQSQLQLAGWFSRFHADLHTRFQLAQHLLPRSCRGAVQPGRAA